VTGVPSPQELAGLPAAELAVRLAEAYRLIAELGGQVERLSARVEELERQARRDSSTSSRPPSSDSPYRKKGGDRSLRERGKRRPGKQPGDPGATMCLVDDPDESIQCPPAACRGCGADLASAPVTAQRLVESYLSTAAKWGISKLDALRDLFHGNAWIPPSLEPAG
jgi:hypothetical protein